MTLPPLTSELAPTPAITDLPGLVAGLDEAARARFDRIYQVSTSTARMRVPKTMVPWVESTFGQVAAVETQQIVRVSNLVTGEGTLFNSLRALRPVTGPAYAPDTLAEELAGDPWAEPRESTPEDLFGRLANEHGVTAANVAKYDSAHSLVVFSDPNPLAFSRESVAAHVDLARQWVEAAQRDDPEAIYPFIMWNCLWRAGGSIVHGHLQASVARGQHYAKIERLRRDAEAYRSATGTDYFQDLVEIHNRLGLAVEFEGVQVIAHLTPLKEKETLITSPAWDEHAAGALYAVLERLRDRAGMRSFNVGIILPPAAPTTESWDGFPAIVRVVDRGGLTTRTSDIGGMEMFAQSVVASDPFAVRRLLAGE